MKGTLKLTSPNDANATMEITMTIREWDAIREALLRTSKCSSPQATWDSPPWSSVIVQCRPRNGDLA